MLKYLLRVSFAGILALFLCAGYSFATKIAPGFHPALAGWVNGALLKREFGKAKFASSPAKRDWPVFCRWQNTVYGSPTGSARGGSIDGFGSSRKIESGHFTIYCAPQLDTGELARELDVRASDRVASGTSYRNDLGGMIDTLFSQVCDILDMQLYSFHGTIKICRDFNHVSAVYSDLFGKDFAKSKSHSFYVYDSNTVYVSAEHFKREVLGHEIGHAVISHYFVVFPSVKIQEVLAVFVEYQLRKRY